jgi:[ribosomal protein S5]-alanine N-acetyltransferase
MSHRIDGDRIYLRDVRASDATPRYVAWLADPDVNRYLETRFQHHSQADIVRYIEAMRKAADAVFLAIVRRADDVHLGNLRLGEIDRYHKTATVALLIGEKTAWGQGYGSEAIALAGRYAFDALGLRKLTARVYANNLGSLQAFLNAGWTREGMQLQQFVSDGEVVDGIWLGCSRDR